MKILFVLLCLVTQILGKKIEIPCPELCKCDIFESFKRATCTSRNIAKLESHLPSETEFLDLSYNQIFELRDSVFSEENLLDLKLLNISNNKLSNIHLRAFRGLFKLKTIDISYNVIQYFHSNWLRDLSSLEELYLKGNSFSMIDSDTIFRSNTLKILDLSKCNINYISKTTFEELPNLTTLDISENFLLHFDISQIQFLNKLDTLLVNNNTFSCDSDMKTLATYCLEKDIFFENPCRIQDTNSEKFQRMINLNDPYEKNSWIFEEEKSEDIKIEAKNCTEIIKKGSLLEEIIELSPSLSVLIVFITGILMGLVIGCSIQIKPQKDDNLDGNTYVSYERSDSITRRKSRRYSNKEPFEERVNLPLREWSLSESTPVLNRKGTLS